MGNRVLVGERWRKLGDQCPGIFDGILRSQVRPFRAYQLTGSRVVGVMDALTVSSRQQRVPAPGTGKDMLLHFQEATVGRRSYEDNFSAPRTDLIDCCFYFRNDRWHRILLWRRRLPSHFHDK